MDTMNFWIEGEPAALARVLERVDLLVINDEEARLLSKEHNLPRAARAIRAMGPKTVIVKRGESGALLFHEHGVFAAPAYPLERVVDPTGAGDTFAGGFMGYLARTGDLGDENLRRAVVYGSAMGSFAVEKFSVQRLLEIDRSHIAARVADFRRLVAFEEEVMA
jgi:sugar/nucleoside kinase (ribokinase family)